MTRSNSIKLILALLLLVGCNASNKYGEALILDDENFSAKFSKPYTRELIHYQYGLEKWNRPHYANAASHFPDTLFHGIEYEFVYIAPVLQGLSSIRLKLKFDHQKMAEDFYSQKTNREIEKEFASFQEFKDSWYCYPDEFGFFSHYNLNNNCEIKLFKAPKCVGKGDGDLGGIASGIAIDRSANIVICWASDLRL